MNTRLKRLKIRETAFYILIFLATREVPNQGFLQDLTNGRTRLGDVVKILKTKKASWNPDDHSGFIFVTGLPKTSGEYLVKSLRENLSADVPESIFRNESIPNHSEFSALTTDKRLHAEFFQLFSYLRTKVDTNPIVKKNSALGSRPDSLIPTVSFEKIEAIILTIRDPGENYVSWKSSRMDFEALSKYSEVELPRQAVGQPDWEAEAAMIFFMDAWENYYTNFLNRLPLGLSNSIYLAEFGDANRVITAICRKYGKEPRLEPHRNRSKSGVPEFFKAKSVIQRRDVIYRSLRDEFGANH